MTFTSIRTYFNDAVLAIDPDLAFIDDIFGDDDVSDVTADKYYKLYFGAATFGKAGNHYTEEIPAFLEIFAGRQRDRTAAFDEVYTKALDIKDQLINPPIEKSSDYFNELAAISASPEPLPTTDNTIKIVLEFNIVRYLGICI